MLWIYASEATSRYAYSHLGLILVASWISISISSQFEPSGCFHFCMCAMAPRASKADSQTRIRYGASHSSLISRPATTLSTARPLSDFYHRCYFVAARSRCVASWGLASNMRSAFVLHWCVVLTAIPVWLLRCTFGRWSWGTSCLAEHINWRLSLPDDWAQQYQLRTEAYCVVLSSVLLRFVHAFKVYVFLLLSIFWFWCLVSWSKALSNHLLWLLPKYVVPRRF